MTLEGLMIEELEDPSRIDIIAIQLKRISCESFIMDGAQRVFKAKLGSKEKNFGVQCGIFTRS